MPGTPKQWKCMHLFHFLKSDITIFILQMKKLKHKDISIPRLIKSCARFKFRQSGLRNHNLNHCTILCSRLHALIINSLVKSIIFFCDRDWITDYAVNGFISTTIPYKNTSSTRARAEYDLFFTRLLLQVVMGIRYPWWMNAFSTSSQRCLGVGIWRDIMARFLSKTKGFPQTAEIVTN